MPLPAELFALIEADPPEFHLAALNRRIRETMDRVLRPHGLKLVEWRVLQSLEAEGALNIQELSELAVVERTITSRLVDRLVERGLVSKSSLQSDKRHSQVSLTRAGGSALEAAKADVAKLRSELFSGLDMSQVEQLLALLKKIVSNGDGADCRLQRRDHSGTDTVR